MKLLNNLKLESGGVVDFGAGNAQITHSSGLLTSNVDIVVPAEVYGAGWDGSNEAPTKNAIYDKIQSLPLMARTVVVSSGAFTAGSASYTDYIYLIAGAHNVTLPAASGNTNRYTFKNNHSANITITRGGTDTVEGATSLSLAPESSVDLVSDGTSAWYVI